MAELELPFSQDNLLHTPPPNRVKHHFTNSTDLKEKVDAFKKRFSTVGPECLVFLEVPRDTVLNDDSFGLVLRTNVQLELS